jgi:serine/threonine protein phosphatase PrpC
MYLAPNQISRPASIAPAGFQLSETLLEQGSGIYNEDALAIKDDLYIVCDGATSLGDCAGPAESSGGQRAAKITSTVFASAAGGDLKERAYRANAEIRRDMGRHGVDFSRREKLWSTSFAAVSLTGSDISWCQSGDCQILLLYQDGNSKLLTPLPDHDVDVLTRWKRIGSSKKGTIHEVLEEDIAAVRRTTNRRFGSLNGEPEALEFLATGCEDGRRVSDILLFSDGLFPPSAFPGRPFDRKTFVAFYQSSGLQGVRDYIRTIQKSDPRCYRYPRFKMHDDMSAIALARF